MCEAGAGNRGAETQPIGMKFGGQSNECDLDYLICDVIITSYSYHNGQNVIKPCWSDKKKKFTSN